MQPKEQPPPPPAPPPAVITPPVVKKDEGATYPAQALADKVKDPVTVVVVVEIDASGVVQKASVETPAGHGFDEAAILAAKKLEYEPAKRNGLPVAAKFLHKYVFTPPTSRLVGRIATERGSRDAPLEDIRGAHCECQCERSLGSSGSCCITWSFGASGLPYSYGQR